MLNWLTNNKELLFGSGGIAALLIGIMTLVRKTGKNNNQKIKSGDSSTNIQTQGDVTLKERNDNDE